MPSDFAPAQIDFSWLANLPQRYQEGVEWRQKQDLRNVFADGLPMLKDGSGPDFNEAASRLAQAGYVNEAIALAKVGDSASGIYGTPIYTRQPGPDGKYNTKDDSIGIAALGKQGGLIPQSAEGFQVLEPQKAVDTGLGTQFVGTRSGQATSGAYYPTDIRGREAAEQAGAVLGKTEGAMPDFIQNVNTSIEAIDEAINHPGRETATGKSSWAHPSNYIGGTDATGYREGVLKKVTGQAFLASVQQMRGLGHLSDAEGAAATQAVSALSTSLPDHEHLQQLRILKAIQLRGLIRAYEKAGQQPPPSLIGVWRQAEDGAGLQQILPFAGGVGTAPAPTPQSQGGSQRRVYDINGNPLR